jgi:hypothetical protein
MSGIIIYQSGVIWHIEIDIIQTYVLMRSIF